MKLLPIAFFAMGLVLIYPAYYVAGNEIPDNGLTFYETIITGIAIASVIPFQFAIGFSGAKKGVETSILQSLSSLTVILAVPDIFRLAPFTNDMWAELPFSVISVFLLFLFSFCFITFGVWQK